MYENKLPQEKVHEAIRALTPKQIDQVMDTIADDGHTLWAPSVLTDAGWPEELVAAFIRVEKSGGTYKTNIYKQGKLVEQVRGVYGLNVLRSINAALGLPGSLALGRGFEARDLSHQIREHMKSEATK